MPIAKKDFFLALGLVVMLCSFVFEQALYNFLQASGHGSNQVAYLLLSILYGVELYSSYHVMTNSRGALFFRLSYFISFCTAFLFLMAHVFGLAFEGELFHGL